MLVLRTASASCLLPPDSYLRQRDEMQIERVRIATLDRVTQRVRRFTVQVDACNRSLSPLEHDVLGFLHVQVGLPEVAEHMREDARSIAMADDEHVGRGRAARQ